MHENGLGGPRMWSKLACLEDDILSLCGILDNKAFVLGTIDLVPSEQAFPE